MRGAKILHLLVYDPIPIYVQNFSALKVLLVVCSEKKYIVHECV